MVRVLPRIRLSTCTGSEVHGSLVHSSSAARPPPRGRGRRSSSCSPHTCATSLICQAGVCSPFHQLLATSTGPGERARAGEIPKQVYTVAVVEAGILRTLVHLNHFLKTSSFLEETSSSQVSPSQPWLQMQENSCPRPSTHSPPFAHRASPSTRLTLHT